MYKTLLILKYLRKRRIAWVSLIAVMLCTTMVIVVMSVMSGWLGMFRESYRGLTGDIIVARRSWSGFPHYQQMIKEIEALPEVKAAVPTIQTFGLANIGNQIRSGVQVVGYPIERIGLVNTFQQSLYRQYGMASDPTVTPEARAEAAERAKRPPTFDLPLEKEEYQRIIGGDNTKQDVSKWPGMIVGSGVIGLRKERDGTMKHPWFIQETWVRLTVMGMNDESSNFDLGSKIERNFWVVDDSRTKIFAQDENTVYVPFDVLQKDLHMDGDSYTDADTGKTVNEPARTTNLQISVKPGADPNAVASKIQAIIDHVLKSNGLGQFRDAVTAKTWEQQQAKFINAIEKEIVLTTGLFAIISVVAVFLIFVIFYMIVVEKTRDIGIIKSVGATGSGVASIFLGYGLAIGIVGGGMGLLVGWLIVRNINELHNLLGERLGVQMWDAETYMFDKIPNTLDPKRVSIIVAVAVISSVVGSLIPAWRAARMNPVEALRWE